METKGKKVFLLYTIFTSLLVIVGFCLLYIYKSPEKYYLVARAYVITEFTLVAYLFHLYVKSDLIRKIIKYSPFAFIIFCTIIFIREKTPGIPFLPISVAHITLLCLIIYYLFEVMQETVLEPIYLKAIFWISVAFIINSAGNFFLFLYSKNSFNDDPNFKRQYTIIYTTVTVIKNLLLCIAILIKETPKIESDKVFFDVDLDSFNPSNNQQ
ncbi:MAG: hypothetical protein JNM14_03075 [Ferruginibacter sp.]|nr:hypothetical protein [Ferruginibacter sp.]